MSDTTQETGGPAAAETPAPAPAGKKSLTEKQVNDAIAEATLSIEQRLGKKVEEHIAALQTQLAGELQKATEAVLAKLEKRGGAAAAGLSAEVKRELLHLNGVIENVATTVERSIGQRVNRKAAVLSLADAAATPAPAEAAAAQQASAEAATGGNQQDTVESLLG